MTSIARQVFQNTWVAILFRMVFLNDRSRRTINGLGGWARVRVTALVTWSRVKALRPREAWWSCERASYSPVTLSRDMMPSRCGCSVSGGEHWPRSPATHRTPAAGSSTAASEHTRCRHLAPGPGRRWRHTGLPQQPPLMAPPSLAALAPASPLHDSTTNLFLRHVACHSPTLPPSLHHIQ